MERVQVANASTASITAKNLMEGKRSKLCCPPGITTQFLVLYRRIGELAETEQEAAALLVAHEEPYEDFRRIEHAGGSDDSLGVIRPLPHMR